MVILIHAISDSISGSETDSNLKEKCVGDRSSDTKFIVTGGRSVLSFKN